MSGASMTLGLQVVITTTCRVLHCVIIYLNELILISIVFVELVAVLGILSEISAGGKMIVHKDRSYQAFEVITNPHILANCVCIH